ncbi:NAD(P)-binding protein [Westerdykella ornata]|uniref:NAD(P)-binding protein n=1 Tax=Westerdykella ornata TaxID=318751 RepID=A0A6A6JKR6_WESOR|nr:NAD(P)-binding protein [Westerdykella ornata]KAF2277181.1 NAD(P)-binding protein [Westerdykella ornata]
MASEAQADVQLHDFKNIFSLEGKVAVVSGGSRGLGLHAASGLLQAGCTKVFITSRKASACAEAVAALNALPTKPPNARAYSIPADSSKVSEIERLVREVSKLTDHVDILFANAGATWGAYFDQVDEKNGWDRVMDLNVKGVFFTIQKFAPLLTKRATTASPSRVIVTGSVAGIAVGSLGASAAYSYAASKAAVLHLVRNLAVELGPRHILVNGIAPGFFPSKMANVLMERSGGVEALERANPNGRVGRPEDVAAAVVFLSSRAAGHVNGDTIVLDGGKMLGSARLERL